MAVPMANGPPFATLNHVAADLGIPNESEPLRVGISDSLSSPTTGEGGNHGCEGEFGKEVYCEAERRGTRTAFNVDSERKEPGAPGTEGADLVEGRCLGSWQRVERQPDHRCSGNQPIHGLPGAQTTGGRRLRGRVEPQAARDAPRAPCRLFVAATCLRASSSSSSCRRGGLFLPRRIARTPKGLPVPATVAYLSLQCLPAFQPASLRRASPPKPTRCRRAANGCTRSSMTASASLLARTVGG